MVFVTLDTNLLINAEYAADMDIEEQVLGRPVEPGDFAPVIWDIIQRGRDIRALVVGDRVVAAMRRTASGDEFRSNVHRGGSVEAVELSSEYKDAAVRSAQIMGLKVAGVDMLEGADGPLVMEVNSSPGLQGIETATQLDVAGAIIDYIANQVAFPEIDVRQRLSVSTGYGVAELLVHNNADLVGKNLPTSRTQKVSVRLAEIDGLIGNVKGAALLDPKKMHVRRSARHRDGRR